MLKPNVDGIWKKTKISILRNWYLMNLRYIALQLCTCTWIENLTCMIIVFYLLYKGQFQLALITLAVMSPLIVFHFAISKLSKSEDNCPSNRCAKIRIRK